ncbi:MAG: hypothetical protein HXX19_08060 [Rhodoferax sp.]|nr:hypothetical protein [Rhodoferax sp.]
MKLLSSARGCLVWGLAGLLAACASAPPTMPPSVADSHAAYGAALADAAVASPAKVQPLRALPAGERVTMVSWVTAQLAPCAKDALPCAMQVGADRLWVTLAGEVQAVCQSWGLKGDALRSRIEQLLGLPTNSPVQYRKTQFVLLEVARTQVERPCLGVTENAAGQPVCTIDLQASTAPEMQHFVGQQMAAAYVMDNPKGPGYPYTRLGYTYDWAADAKPGHYGASEFVVAPGSTAKAVRIMATDDYCQPP